MCYGPPAIHTICKYSFICAILYNSLCLFITTVTIQSVFFHQGLSLNRFFFLFFLYKNNSNFPLFSPGRNEEFLWRFIFGHTFYLRKKKNDPRLRINFEKQKTSGSSPLARLTSRETRGHCLEGQGSATSDLCSLAWSSSRWITVTLHHEW